jgi:hypothetical protein
MFQLSLLDATADAEDADQPRRATQSFQVAQSPTSSFRGPTPKLHISPALSVASGINSTSKSHLASSRHQDFNMTPIAQPDMEMSLEKSSRKDASRLIQSGSKTNKAASSLLTTHSRVSDQNFDLSDNESLPVTRRKPVKSKSTGTVSDFVLSPYAGSNKSSIQSAKEVEVADARQSAKLRKSTKTVDDAESEEIPLERMEARSKSSNSDKSSFNLSLPSARNSGQPVSKESNLDEISAGRRSNKAQRTTKSTSDMDISSLGNTMNGSKSKSNTADNTDEEEDIGKFSRKSKKSKKQSEDVLSILEQSPAKNLRSSSIAKDQDSDSDDELPLKRRVQSKKSTFVEDFDISLPLTTPPKSVRNDDDTDDEVLLEKVPRKDLPSKSSIDIGSQEQQDQIELSGSDKNEKSRQSKNRSDDMEQTKSNSSVDKSGRSSSIIGSASANNNEEDLRRQSRKSSKSVKQTKSVSSDLENSPAKNLRSSSTAKDQDSDSEVDLVKTRRVKSKKSSFVEDIDLSLPSTTPGTSVRNEGDTDDEIPLQRESGKNQPPKSSVNLAPRSSNDKHDQSKVLGSDQNKEKSPTKKSRAALQPSKVIDKSGRSSSNKGRKSTGDEEEEDPRKEDSRKSKSGKLSNHVEENGAPSLSSSPAAKDQDSDSEVDLVKTRRVKSKKSSFVEDIDLSLPPTTPATSVRNKGNTDDKVPLENDSNKDRHGSSSMSIATQSSQELPDQSSSNRMPSGNEQNKDNENVSERIRERSADLETTKSTTVRDKIIIASNSKSTDEEEDMQELRRKSKKSKKQSKAGLSELENSPVKNLSNASTAKDLDSDPEIDIVKNRRAKTKKSTNSTVDDFNLTGLTTPAKSVRNVDDSDDEVPLQRNMRNYTPSKRRDSQSSQEQQAEISPSTRQDNGKNQVGKMRKESSAELGSAKEAPNQVEENSTATKNVSRISKQLQEVEEILNFSKKSASAFRGKDYKVLRLSRSIDNSKASGSIIEASVASKESLPDPQRKGQTQTSNTSSEAFNLQLEKSMENTADDGTRIESPKRTKSAASSRELVLDAENDKLKRSKSWAANAHTPSVADALLSQASARSSQTTHVSESPDEETQDDTIDMPEFDIGPGDGNAAVEAEKSNSKFVEKQRVTAQFRKSPARRSEAAKSGGTGEDGSGDASSAGLPIASDESEDEMANLNRKRKAAARSTLDEDGVGGIL